MTQDELREIIAKAAVEEAETLALSNNQLSQLPPEIGQLSNLTELNLSNNQLSQLPPEIGQLSNLTELNLSNNQLSQLPPEIGQLSRLTSLVLSNNQLSQLPPEIGQLSRLTYLHVRDNQLHWLPSEIGQLSSLTLLYLGGNQLSQLPPEIGQLMNLSLFSLYNNQLSQFSSEIFQLSNITYLNLSGNQLSQLPPEIVQLSSLTSLHLSGTQLSQLPPEIVQLSSLTRLHLSGTQLSQLPPEIVQLSSLSELDLSDNQLSQLPPEIGQLSNFTELVLRNNPLNPAVRSAYEVGLKELLAYQRSLEDAEPIFEAKLVLVGEGDVGKTTLLKALTGKSPEENESTTHGVEIDSSLRLPHPEKPEVELQFNSWDFGGQEVYRVTHQFFFSPRAIYLLLWEPRRGVEGCRVEEWLKMIRLRVGPQARVILVSTYAKSGERIARIDKPVFIRDYGSMIVDFIEVDSLEEDPTTGDKVGLKRLKELIAETAVQFSHVGMLFNTDWRKARDELLGMAQPRISYATFGEVCARHGLNPLATKTLATLMHDLGYIVYYGDDEHLQQDVVLHPEWLTKAIGFVLEDRTTNELNGILADDRLKEVWLNHSFKDQPRYPPELYPFFLRLMEKFDVSYRLEEGNASLVAQHVPQIRPALPWLPEEDVAERQKRISMVSVMDDAPPGLIPWLIVRTHDYAYERASERLHWQKGMFLRNKGHGEAMLELRERELHLYAEAVWPDYFMTVLKETLQALINEKWPGMDGRYRFTVPCREKVNGKGCNGRFEIDALRQFLEEGDTTIRCQSCRQRQKIVELLYGFEEEDSRQQLAQIEAKMAQGFEEVTKQIEGLESRLANYVMGVLRAIANEAKDGPRLFMITPADGNWRRLINKKFHLYLVCEAEGCQHQSFSEDVGIYEFTATREWVNEVAPYANFVFGLLKLILPSALPLVNVAFGADIVDDSGWKDRLNLMKGITSILPSELERYDDKELRGGLLSEPERSGLLALHALLRELDPNQARLGLRRVPTYTGDYLWLCQKHYEETLPNIPDKIE